MTPEQHRGLRVTFWMSYLAVMAIILTLATLAVCSTPRLTPEEVIAEGRYLP